MPDPPGPADHLPAHEERREVTHDVAERRRPAASGSSRGRRTTRPCCRCCSCRGGSAARPVSVRPCAAASSMISSPALSHRTMSSGVGDLGRGVLRVGVVDVQPGTVGEDDVGEAEVLVGELAGVGELPAEVEAAGVAQRRLLLEVPPGASRLDGGAGVGVDDLRARHHRVGVRLSLHRDAVLDLGAHHPPYGHVASLRAGPGAGPPSSLLALRPGGCWGRSVGQRSLPANLRACDFATGSGLPFSAVTLTGRSVNVRVRATVNGPVPSKMQPKTMLGRAILWALFE